VCLAAHSVTIVGEILTIVSIANRDIFLIKIMFVKLVSRDVFNVIMLKIVSLATPMVISTQTTTEFAYVTMDTIKRVKLAHNVWPIVLNVILHKSVINVMILLSLTLLHVSAIVAQEPTVMENNVWIVYPTALNAQKQINVSFAMLK
jgi:hypothetical protein